MMRIQSTATQVNTIRRTRLTSLLGTGEVKPGARASGAVLRPRHGGCETGVCVVGGSRLERGRVCEDRRSVGGGRSQERPAEVRAIIVAEKPGNAGGAKGGRKAEIGTSPRGTNIRHVDCSKELETPETKTVHPRTRNYLRRQLVIIDGREPDLWFPPSRHSVLDMRQNC